VTNILILSFYHKHAQQRLDQNVEKLRRRDTALHYTCVKGDYRTFSIVWGQSKRGFFIYVLQDVNIWNFKHSHQLPERCVRHDVEGVFKVNVDSINSLALSPSFLLDEKHLLHVHVNADTSSLPASTLPWFQDVSWLDNVFQLFGLMLLLLLRKK